MDNSQQDSEKNRLGFSNCAWAPGAYLERAFVVTSLVLVYVNIVYTSKQEVSPSQTQKNHPIWEQKAESLSVQFC